MNVCTTRSQQTQAHHYSGPQRIIPILGLPQLPMLLVNTHQPRSTEYQIKKVRQNVCKTTHLDEIEGLARSALELLVLEIHWGFRKH